MTDEVRGTATRAAGRAKGELERARDARFGAGQAFLVGLFIGWAAVAVAVATVALALPAAAHDPGQGDVIGEVAFRIAVDELELELSADLPDDTCPGEPVSIIGRRGGRVVSTTARLRDGCVASGVLTVDEPGRWFVYVAEDRFEAWVPVQAGGTRGATLAAGADHLRMFGQDVPIRAEVVQLQSFSGHADADEILDWMGGARRTPTMTYLTHGEPDAADTLRGRINRELKWEARVPEHLERIDLERPA